MNSCLGRLFAFFLFFFEWFRGTLVHGLGPTSKTCTIKPDENGTVTIPSNWTYIPPLAFFSCNDLEYIKWHGAVEKIESLAFGASNLREIHLPDSITVIEEGAFANCMQLETVVLSNNLRFIGSGVFTQNFRLQSLVIPDSVTTAGKDLCKTCLSLTDLSIGNSLEVVSVRSFAGCFKLKEIAFGENVKVIEQEAFERTAIRELILPDSLETVGYRSFASCRKLVNVVIPNSVKLIEHGAFGYNNATTSILFGDSIENISSNAFIHNTALQAISFGSRLKSIGEKAFYTCSSVQSISFQEGITSIGDSAFGDCINLGRVVIPKTVMSIGTQAFNGDLNLSYVQLKSPTLHFLGTGAFSQTGLLYGGLVYWKGLRITGYRGDHGFVMALQCREGDGVNGKDNSNSGAQCGCMNGFGNYLADPLLTDDYFSCSPCPIGRFNDRLNIGYCTPCRNGTFSADEGAAECAGCEAGKYSEEIGATSNTTCQDCSPGTYNSVVGSPTCTTCPPGSFCPSSGLFRYHPCARGFHSNSTGRTKCSMCPTGRYQPNVGEALCLACQGGTYNDQVGAENSSFCRPCSTGRYGSVSGLGQCPQCPEKSVQPDTGMTSCQDCTIRYTSNAEFTACVVDERLLSRTLVALMFEDGVALSGTAAISAAFLAVAIAMHMKKQSHNQSQSEGRAGDRTTTTTTTKTLGQSTLHEVALKSLLPGFSFASELFLIVGMMSEVPALGVTVLLFRLLHLGVGIALNLALFGPSSFTGTLDDLLGDYEGHGVSCARQELQRNRFAQYNVALISVLALLTTCDVTMAQFFPWTSSTFFQRSRGYPSMAVMSLCMAVKAVQGLASAVCQIAYLLRPTDSDSADAGNNGVNDPTTTTQAKALFILNIMASLGGCLVSALFLCMKRGLLSETENERKMSSGNNNSEGEGEGEDVSPMHDPPTHKSTPRNGTVAALSSRAVDIATESKAQTEAEAEAEAGVEAGVEAEAEAEAGVEAGVEAGTIGRRMSADIDLSLVYGGSNNSSSGSGDVYDSTSTTHMGSGLGLSQIHTQNPMFVETGIEMDTLETGLATPEYNRAGVNYIPDLGKSLSGDSTSRERQLVRQLQEKDARIRQLELTLSERERERERGTETKREDAAGIRSVAGSGGNTIEMTL